MKKLLCLLLSLILLCPLGVFAATENTSGNITVNSGETFTISLKQVSDGGYSWEYTVNPSKGLTLVSDKTSTDKPNVPGSPTTRTYTFKANESGTYTIKFVQARPWDKSDIASTKTVNVTVNDGNNIVTKVDGCTFTISLKESEAIGYNWKYVSLPKGVTFISEKLNTDSNGNKTRDFTFKSDNPGTYKIDFKGCIKCP